MLVHLVTNHGRLVSKSELFDAIWPGRVVTDDSLTQCLIEIRRAIGDEDRTKIRTISRRGYIFEAPLEEVDGLGSSSQPREARILGTGRVAAVSVAMIACLIAGWIILSSETTEPCCNGLEVPISIFVPPITTNGIETPDGDLLRTEVVRRLSKIAIFRVLDGTPAAGREHADFHVAASLVDTEPATAGIRLVRLNDGEILWSESFGWEPGQQTNIAERLARAMKVYLDPRIVQEARSSSRALDPHALSAYLDGLVECLLQATITQPALWIS
jgi:hypothetical protein